MKKITYNKKKKTFKLNLSDSVRQHKMHNLFSLYKRHHRSFVA